MEWSHTRPVKEVVETVEAAGTALHDDETKREAKGKAPAASRCLCYCPIEGCTTKPQRKLSNHLAQVHKLNVKERVTYLGQKRKFAPPSDIQAMRQRSVPRKSQRLLDTFFKSTSPGPEPETEEVEVVEEEEEDTSSVVAIASTTELVEEPTASLDPDSQAAQEPEARGRTRGAGSHSLDEECLVEYASFLCSRNGGRKTDKQAKEILVDLAKFLTIRLRREQRWLCSVWWSLSLTKPTTV